MTLDEYHALVETVRNWLGRRRFDNVSQWEGQNVANILLPRTVYLSLLLDGIDEPLGIRPYCVIRYPDPVLS